MELAKAKEVLDAVENGEYPPTNPAVLLEAARTIYLNQSYFPDGNKGVMRILVWTIAVMEQNSGN